MAKSSKKDAKVALSESEGRLRAIFESAEEAIIALDGDGCLQEVNPAAGVITGVPHDQLIGRFLEEFVDPSFDLKPAWEDFLESA